MTRRVPENAATKKPQSPIDAEGFGSHKRMQLLDQEARQRSSLEATFSADIAQWDAHGGQDDDEEATAMEGNILSGYSDDEAADSAEAGGVSTPDSLSREEMPRLAPVATPKR